MATRKSLFKPFKECKETQAVMKKGLEEVQKVLAKSGLSTEIIGCTTVAGLVASYIIKDRKIKVGDVGNENDQVLADEAFELFDIDHNGNIQRGDIEIFLTLSGFTVEEISELSKKAVETGDTDKDGCVSRKEFRETWKKVDDLRAFMHEVDVTNMKAEIAAKYGAEGPENIPLYAFGAIRSFYRLPVYPTKPSERQPAHCVFFGCPFDSSVTYRTGARFGPAAVRQASQMTSFGYAPWIDRDFSKMKIYDAGDAPATPFDIHTAMNQVYLHAKKLWNSSQRVIGIGGDHLLSWCVLRAARDLNNGDPVALIHLDSHLDTGDEYMGNKMSHGTALRRAMEDGCIDVKHSYHVGIHGSTASKDLILEDEKKGWKTITLDDFVEMGPVEAAKLVKERVGDRRCIVSFDIDVLEPGECPGIGFPEPGGMRSRELFKFLRELKGVKCIGGEVCEFTPEYDSNGVTAHACAQGAYEIMCLALNDVN